MGRDNLNLSDTWAYTQDRLKVYNYTFHWILCICISVKVACHVGPFGGNGGDIFSDAAISQAGDISSMIINHGRLVDG